MAQLLGVHGTSAAQTSGETEEAWDVAVPRPKMNDPPVELHSGRGPRVQGDRSLSYAPILVLLSSTP